MMELKVGDVFYSVLRGYPGRSYKITRVTQKRAFSGPLCFKREYSEDGFLTEVGYRGSVFSRLNYFIETPELKAGYESKKLIQKLDAIDWKQVPEDKRLAVAEIVFYESVPGKGE